MAGSSQARKFGNNFVNKNVEKSVQPSFIVPETKRSGAGSDHNIIPDNNNSMGDQSRIPGLSFNLPASAMGVPTSELMHNAVYSPANLSVPALTNVNNPVTTAMAGGQLAPYSAQPAFVQAFCSSPLSSHGFNSGAINPACAYYSDNLIHPCPSTPSINNITPSTQYCRYYSNTAAAAPPSKRCKAASSVVVPPSFNASSYAEDSRASDVLSFQYEPSECAGSAALEDPNALLQESPSQLLEGLWNGSCWGSNHDQAKLCKVA